MSFPVDSVTLEMLLEACRIGSGYRTHLNDFLDFMSTMGGAKNEVSEIIDDGLIEIHVMSDNSWQYSTSDVIEALATEILRMRENL